MELIFRSIFWIGVASLVLSFFIDLVTSLSYFLLAFIGGIVLVAYSLFEQYLLNKQLPPLPAAQPSPQPSAEQQQPSASIAKRMPPLVKPLKPQLIISSSQRRGFFTRLFGSFHFRKKQQPTLKPLPLASLDNVKQLFAEDPHLRRQAAPGTFQRPNLQSYPPSFYQRTMPPTAAHPSQPPPTSRAPFQKKSSEGPEASLPFEEGLEHYVPSGAEQLPHDHHNRYAEERELVSQPSDQRYQQVSQQQRTPLLQSSPHHLSLLHYLHYKDRKHERTLFIILFCLSLLLIAVSLFLPYRDYVAFVVTLLFLGLILLSTSIAELLHLRRHLAAQPILQSPVSATPQQPIAKTLAPQQQPAQPSPQPAQRPAAAQQPSDTEHLVTLIAYVRQSLRQHYPLDAIRAAAKQSGWPETLIEQAIVASRMTASKKKKVLVLVSLVGLLLILLVALNSSDMFLLPYWFELLGDATPQFYLIMSVIFLIVILLFVYKVNKLYKAKKIQYKVTEEQHIAEIKQELQHLPTTIARGTYETDFDRLYKLLSEKQKLTVTEVAQGFSVSRKEAEEWGKILKEQGLIELHYPTVGDLELRWKK